MNFAMYIVDADNREFIAGFYVTGNVVPQSGDLIRFNDCEYKVEKRLFEVITEGDIKKNKEVKFNLLVKKEGGEK